MKFVIAFIVVAAILTIGLPMYLGPDDIAGCKGPANSGKCAKVDAIIAISGGDTTARAQEAIRLFKAGWSTKLIFSGAAADKNGPSNAKVMEELAIKEGVSSSAITIDEYSNTTAENATNTATLVHDMQLTRVMLVTSVYHQRRANIEFSKRLGSGVQIVNHPTTNDNQWSTWWWVTPYGWALGIGEIVKIIFAEASGL